MRQVFVSAMMFAVGDQGAGGNATGTVSNPLAGLPVGYNPGPAIVQGAQFGQPSTTQIVDRQGNTRVAPPFNARVNIDSRFPNERNRRPANMQEVPVTDVRRYVSVRDGSPRVAFNRGAIHISLAQMESAGVHYPESLVGKTMMVDFFQPGDILINGSVVADGGRIVNQFLLEPDREVAREIEKEIAMKKHNSWASLVSNRLGANNRPTGSGTTVNTMNGVTSANSIPGMADANQRFGQGVSQTVLAEQQAQQSGANQDNTGGSEPLGSENEDQVHE